jgi:hypothetical protein
MIPLMQEKESERQKEESSELAFTFSMISFEIKSTGSGLREYINRSCCRKEEEEIFSFFSLFKFHVFLKILLKV